MTEWSYCCFCHIIQTLGLVLGFVGLRKRVAEGLPNQSKNKGRNSKCQNSFWREPGQLPVSPWKKGMKKAVILLAMSRAVPCQAPQPKAGHRFLRGPPLLVPPPISAHPPLPCPVLPSPTLLLPSLCLPLPSPCPSPTPKSCSIAQWEYLLPGSGTYSSIRRRALHWQAQVQL